MTLAQTLPTHKPSTLRRSFILKAVLAIGLTFLADIVLSGGSALFEAGSVAGLLAFLWLAALLICNPAMRTSRASHFALAGAGLAALALTIEPGIIAALLFPLYLGLALFLPRYGSFGNALAWPFRLAFHALLGPWSALLDLMRLGQVAGRSRRHVGFFSLVSALPLTVVGSLVFLALFSDANPLIDRGLSQAVAAVTAPGLIGWLGSHLVFLFVVLMLLWGSLRPLRRRFLVRHAASVGAKPARRIPFDAVAVIPALVAFNAIFAMQNLSDIAFLWGGAALPDGMTFSDYARRGTDALIVAALLAEVFVLVFLRTGSPLSANRTVRLLVYAWIGQTVLLVLSSMERTLNYIEAYSLTYTRLNALIFMALVAAGLVLICWRMAKDRNGSWLVNANALCLAAVLGCCSFTNYDAVITRWNLAQSQQAGVGIVKLDSSYLHKLGASGALLPLAEATQDPGSPYADLAGLRRRIQMRLDQQQADWRRWTVAGAWRLWAAGPLPQLPPPAAPQAPKPPQASTPPMIQATPNP